MTNLRCSSFFRRLFPAIYVWALVLIVPHLLAQTEQFRAFNPNPEEPGNYYGLPDLASDVAVASEYSYMRWGVLMSDADYFPDRVGAPGSWRFRFTKLTDESQRSNNSTELFFLERQNEGIFKKIDFPESAASGWDKNARVLSVPESEPAISRETHLLRKYHFSKTIRDEMIGEVLAGDAQKVIVLIHGWNPESNANSYDDPKEDKVFYNLVTALKNSLKDSGWSLVLYRWEADSDTGPLLGELINNFGPINGTEAAEAGHLHGKHLGHWLAERCPGIRRVHFIAHSAGSWAARSAALYLMDHEKADHTKPDVQVTLLDPFIPGNVTAISSNLKMDVMQKLAGKTWRVENYFANDPIVFGTNERLFNGTQGFDYKVGIGEPADGEPLDKYFGLRNFGSYVGYTDGFSHDGPIAFYSDSVSKSKSELADNILHPSIIENFDLAALGWSQSMAMSEPHFRLEPKITGSGETRLIDCSVIVKGPTSSSIEYRWETARSATGPWTPIGGNSRSLALSGISLVDAGRVYRVTATANGLSESRGITLNVLSVSGVSPAVLQAKPTGLTQTITINGTGFTTASRLSFSTGSESYPDRVPAYVSPTELRYAIAVGPTAASWTVKVTNGADTSAAFPFSVVAASRELQSISISGSSAVTSGQSVQYTTTAFYADGSSAPVNANWVMTGNPSTVQLSSTGLLTVGALSAPANLIISAGYTAGGILKLASFAVAASGAGTVGGSGSYSIIGPSIIAAKTGSAFHLMQVQPNGSTLEVPARWDSSNTQLLRVTAAGVATAADAVASESSVAVFAYVGPVGNETRIDKIVSVVPAPGDHYFKISVLSSSSGSVAFQPLPEVIDGVLHFKQGTVVTATAMPSGDNLLRDWGGMNSTSNPLVFTMTGDTQLQPNFVPAGAITGPKTLTIEKPTGLGRLSITSSQVGHVLERPDRSYTSAKFSTNENVNLNLEISPAEEFIGWFPGSGQDLSRRISMVDHYQQVARIRSRLASSTPAERTRQTSIRLGAGYTMDGYLINVNGRYAIDNSETLVVNSNNEDAYLRIENYALATFPQHVVSASLRFTTVVLTRPASMRVMLSDRAIANGSESTAPLGRVPSAIDYGGPTVAVGDLGQQCEVDITGVYNQWRSGEIPNNGLLLRWVTSRSAAYLGSCNSTDVSRRPELILNWIEEPATAVAPIFVSQALLEPVLSAGGAVRIGVAAVSDGAVTYSWTKDGVLIAGAATPEIYVSDTDGSGAGVYTLTATNPQGSTTQSFTVRPPVMGGPTLLKSPESLSEVVGNTATFSCAAAGSNLRYQWSRNNQPLANDGHVSGAFGPRLTVASLSALDAGEYSVTIFNDLGTVESQPATLSVSASMSAPQIISSPATRLVSQGGATTFSVQVSGAPQPTIQWLHNGAEIPGATGETLYVGPASRRDAGSYVARVSNGSGAVLSRPGFLMIDYGPTTLVSQGWSSQSSAVPFPAALTDALMVSAGDWFDLALRRDGTVIAWGDNNLNQCNVPTSLTSVVSIACGSAFGLALRSDGTVVAWGDNAYGQSIVPAGLQDVVAIAAGSAHALAIKSDGTVVGWGANYSGQIDIPVGLSQVVAVAAGGGHSLALRSDGTLVGWGGNANGQCDTPLSAGGFAAIAAGSSHSLAIRQDGSLIGWGYDGFQNTVCPAGNDFVAISTSNNNLSATRSNGTIVRWGHDGYGNQNLSSRANVVNAASGAYHTVVLEGLMINYCAPRFIQAPSNQVLVVGDSASLSVRLEGIPEPHIQWRKNGVPIDGATSPILLLSTVTMGATGSYDVVATNSVGTAVSSPAFVQIGLVQPTLNWPKPRPISYGTLLTGTEFSARADVAGSFQYSFNSYTILPVGEHILTAIFTPSNPAAAIAGMPISTLLTVQPADQVISFDAPANQAFSTVPIQLRATASSGLPITFSLVSGPANLVGNSLTLTGPGLVTVRASQFGGANHNAASSVDRTITVSGVSSYASWKLNAFTASELSDTGVSGPNADPDGDGYHNLLEYALGLEPKTATVSGLPEISTSGADWAYTYTRPSDRSDVTYVVEVSTDMVSWTTIGVSHALVSATGGNETWRATFPLAASPKAFLRLKVTQP